jgi:hypothetical protein
MRAPIVKVTLGDYLYRVPGFLQSVNVTVDNSTSWEINLEDSTDVQELPHVLEVAITFKPIHDVLPERSSFTQYIKQGKMNVPTGIRGNSISLDTETAVTDKKVTSLIGNPTTNFINKDQENLLMFKKNNQPPIITPPTNPNSEENPFDNFGPIGPFLE